MNRWFLLPWCYCSKPKCGCQGKKRKNLLLFNSKSSNQYDLWHVCCLQEWDGGERRWWGAAWRLHWGQWESSTFGLLWIWEVWFGLFWTFTLRSVRLLYILSGWFGFGEVWFDLNFSIEVSDVILLHVPSVTSYSSATGKELLVLNEPAWLWDSLAV